MIALVSSCRKLSRSFLKVTFDLENEVRGKILKIVVKQTRLHDVAKQASTASSQRVPFLHNDNPSQKLSINVLIILQGHHVTQKMR
jgi:hypothetical protein